ncbi:SOS response-associated peptidase [Proteiniphilum acetatigenes]|uniref:SOS response-associated peptidase n=1 Tax=Proteiniphilum acetatigenes TaxID=294710 RepID=UPI000371CC6D|nr:SOS response-associated peptidase [Proteiniphilum acetatigenes]
MCFTVSVEKKAKEAIKDYLKSNKGVQFDIYFEDYYLVSGFAHPKLPVIKQDTITLSEWGLIPSFVYSEEMALDMKSKTLNARSDTIHEKRSYKDAIKSQRCVLIVDGFFEWRHEEKKIPFYIYPKDETVFYLGCIYNSWVNKLTGEIHDTFSIITTDANPMMEYIHNSKKRMPLILHKNNVAKWINPETPQSEIDELMKPYTESLMTSHIISTDAGNSRKNRNVANIKCQIK